VYQISVAWKHQTTQSFDIFQTQWIRLFWLALESQVKNFRIEKMAG